MEAPISRGTPEILESVQLLIKILTGVEDKNLKLQQICHQNQSLFKPWPSHKKNTEVQEEDNKHNNEKEKEKVALTSEEQAGLAIMDKLLVKAQKARRVQNKVNESKVHGPRLSPNSSKITKTKNNSETPPKSHDRSHDEESCYISEDHSGDGDLSQKNNVENKISAKSCDGETNKSFNVVKNDSSQTSYKAGGVSRKTPTNQTSGTKVLRLTSETKSAIEMRGNRYDGIRINSGDGRGKKIVPAHMKAPFKTNPTISMPKRAVNKRPISGRSATSVPSLEKPKNNVSTNKNKTSSQILPSSKSTVQPSNNNEVVRSQVVSHHDDIKNFEFGSQDAQIMRTKAVSSQPLVDMDEVSEKVKDIKVEDKDKCIDEPEKPFCLLTDGSSLSIPVSLKRLQTNNTKLRQKYHIERVTRKVDVTQAGQDFITKLQTCFEYEEEAVIGQRVFQIYQSYTKLLNLFNKINLEKISANSSSYELLQARKYLEFILATFHQLEEDRLSLDPALLKRLKYIKSYDTSLIQIHPELKQPHCHWLPSSLSSDDCVNIPTYPHTIQYRSHKDLYRYTYLLFQIQYLQLQLSLMDIIAMETIPILQSLDPNSMDFIHMFRSVYSMLSPGSFPVIVKDTIQELDDG